MKAIKWMTGILACFAFTLMSVVASSPAAEVQDIQVGRIYNIEGELLRYVPEDNDWVAVVKDAPFGAEDTLFSGNKGKAEMIVPNGTWVRVGNNTQIQFISLYPDMSEMDVASGTARFYNKGSNTVVKATSPFGYVLSDPETVFDFYVGENSVEVVAIKGTVSFVHSAGNARYNVSEGSPSILADQNRVSTGEGTVDPVWDRWNENRDRVWTAKLNQKGRSAEYLPPNLKYEAHCLDENGRWELLRYQGRDCWFWRPTGVYVGWSPFTVGVWTEWCGDQTWLPAEPFGYITHHYGNWVFIGDFWCWSPPVVGVRLDLPLLDIGFYWYPGRVSWIHRGVYVGWVPLAPHETYYSRHNWGGPHHRLVHHETVNQVNINIRNYTYVNHAVIVDHNSFYGVENYRNVRVANVHPVIINKYDAAPVVNGTVISNYDTNRQRYKYANAEAKEKPHSSVLNRLRQNETIIRHGREENAASLKQQVKSTKEGKISRDVRIETPRATNYIVPADDANRPKSELKLQEKEVKSGRETASGMRSGETAGADRQPGQSGQAVTQPGRISPAVPSQHKKAVITPGRTAPETQPRQNNTVKQPEVVSPAIPAQPKAPVAQPVDTGASKSERQEKAVSQPVRVKPAVPSQQNKPVTEPERIAPKPTTQSEKTVDQTKGTATAQKKVTKSQTDSIGLSTPAESSSYRLKKTVKSESAAGVNKAQVKTSQKKAAETSKQQKSVKDEQIVR